MERESAGWISAAVMQSVYRSVVVRNELSPNAKLFVYWSVCASNLSYGERELWVVAERISLWIRAAKMSFFSRVAP